MIQCKLRDCHIKQFYIKTRLERERETGYKLHTPIPTNMDAAIK